jgi:hypothetical protein
MSLALQCQHNVLAERVRSLRQLAANRDLHVEANRSSGSVYVIVCSTIVH